jgi:hypothetical protein
MKVEAQRHFWAKLLQLTATTARKERRIAIVHVAFKSSSKAPSAAEHAQYIARDVIHVSQQCGTLVKGADIDLWRKSLMGLPHQTSKIVR